MRNKIRSYWLWLVQEYKRANSMCALCGKWGASICSLVYPKRLCDGCATEVCRKADQREAVKVALSSMLNTKKVING